MSEATIKEQINGYEVIISKLIKEREELIKPLDKAILKNTIAIRRLQENCEHSWGSWYGHQYDRERKCKLCGAVG